MSSKTREINITKLLALIKKALGGGWVGWFTALTDYLWNLSKYYISELRRYTKRYVIHTKKQGNYILL